MLKALRELIEFLWAYPLWVRVVMVCLLAGVFLLLVVFRPGSKPPQETVGPPGDGTNSAAGTLPDVVVPPVGRRVLLDVSQGQSEWRGLTAWATASNLDITLMNKPFTDEEVCALEPGVLVWPLPYHQHIADSSAKAVRSWVEQGGGLLVLGYYAADTHHGTSPSRLTREWGVSFRDDLVMPANASQGDTRRHVIGSDVSLGAQIAVSPQERHDIAAGVQTVVMLSAASLDLDHATVPMDFSLETSGDSTIWHPEGPLDPNGMRLIIEQWIPAGSGPLPVLAAFRFGRGKVAICGTWKIASLSYGDNRRLMSNIINWLRPG